MIQTVIIAIPGLIALIECIRRGPEHAMLDVYLPVLLLLPEYTWPISGQYSFADTTIIPIAFFLLIQSKLKWKWNTIDFLVIGYMAITAIAEGMNNGYKLGTQNLLLQDSAAILLPYIAARQMFRHPQFGVDVAKRVAVLLTVVAILSVYEFRMGSNLFTRFFEGAFGFVSLNTTVFRAGFMRTQGPYSHAITFGIMMAMGFRVVRWLDWTGEWNGLMPFLPIRKVRFCELGIIAGSIMSLSVGPWLAAAGGSLIVAVCRARNRKRAILSLLLLGALVGGPLRTAFNDYVSVDPAVAAAEGDQLREDSAYRNMLLPVYIPVVEERPTWGWGRGGFPVLDGMQSIDNAYLLIALTFGVYALAMMVGLFVWPAIRVAIYSFSLQRNDPRALAAFSMIGIFVINAIVDCTGSGGGPPWRFLFVVAGWSSALLTAPAPQTVEAAVGVSRWPRIQFGFRRVMV